MILIDWSMICVSNFIEAAGKCTEDDKEFALQHGYVQFVEGHKLCYETYRFAILESLRKYNNKFGQKYGQIVICPDCKSKDYWRKKYNQYYKGNRKKQGHMPWELYAVWIQDILKELSDNFPYLIVGINCIEGDDTIGVLSLNTVDEDVLIVSRDHDFKQLLINKNVRQYCPVTDKYLDYTQKEAREYLFKHIVKGDKGDGIPNILSPENIFVEIGADGLQIGRQPQIRQKKLDLWRTMEPSEFCPDATALERYERNSKMIDLSRIPQKYVDAILKRYKMGPKTKNNDKIDAYIASINADKEHCGDYPLKPFDFYMKGVVQLNPFEQRKMDQGLFAIK